MADSPLQLALVGATSLVGREVLAILNERRAHSFGVRLYGRARNAGEVLEWNGAELTVSEVSEESFQDADVAVFTGGRELSAEFVESAAQSGAVVIDTSNYSRHDADVLLAVPEINGEQLRTILRERQREERCVIGCPNAATVPLAIVLKPFAERIGLKRVIISTYQSVSGAGQSGMDELWNQTLAIFRQQELVKRKFPHQIAFSCIPQIDAFLANGSTAEEQRIIEETRTLLGLPALPMSATAVRVPTFIAHAASVNIELEGECSPEAARELLRASPGVVVSDAPATSEYPVGIEVGGTDATYVGRIRLDESVPHGLNLWVVADNVRKGAALNAVQVLEIASSVLRPDIISRVAH